jgi:ATP-dependent phosphoenolpyruvate carboxykinase
MGTVMRTHYSTSALKEINESLKGKSPQEIVSWAISIAENPVLPPISGLMKEQFCI